MLKTKSIIAVVTLAVVCVVLLGSYGCSAGDGSPCETEAFRVWKLGDRVSSIQSG